MWPSKKSPAMCHWGGQERYRRPSPKLALSPHAGSMRHPVYGVQKDGAETMRRALEEDRGNRARKNDVRARELVGQAGHGGAHRSRAPRALGAREW